MLAALVNFKLAVDRAAEAVVRDHSAHRALDQELRMTLTACLERLGLVTADVTGEAHVGLLNFLFAAYADFAGIDHDDKVTGINVSGINGLALAAQEVGGLDGYMAEMLVGRIDDPPIALHIGSFCRECLH